MRATNEDHQQSNMSYYIDCFRSNPNPNCDSMKRNSSDSDGSPNYSEINFGRNISDYALIPYGGNDGNQQTETSTSSVSYGQQHGGFGAGDFQQQATDMQRQAGEIPWGHCLVKINNHSSRLREQDSILRTLL